MDTAEDERKDRNGSVDSDFEEESTRNDTHAD